MSQVMPEGLIHEPRQPKTSVGVQATSKVMGSRPCHLPALLGLKSICAARSSNVFERPVLGPGLWENVVKAVKGRGGEETRLGDGQNLPGLSHILAPLRLTVGLWTSFIFLLIFLF